MYYRDMTCLDGLYNCVLLQHSGTKSGTGAHQSVSKPLTVLAQGSFCCTAAAAAAVGALGADY